ncbi:alpha/beta fold hydrolase [Photobacterium damselae]|uniref:alpha/beta fold hydrolase n=1 Tax=Photobacterium damselae TaxID=38293 RepID=UPI001F24DDAC|nr:alpha/beta hydrolase [Photobacterium damselae]UKA03994.1 alpha/beta hydrolase [Photobacterium damselae subsp. damselae]
MNSSLFYHQETYFKNNYRIMCCDIRGFGKTNWIKQDFSLYDVLSDIVQLLQYLKITQCIWVGRSLGGYIALRTAIKYPEMINKLILIATQSGNDNYDTVQSFLTLRDNWNDKTCRKKIVNGLYPVLIGTENPEYLEWEKIWEKYDNDCIYYSMNAMLTRDSISVSHSNILSLIIHGSKDEGTPVSAAISSNKALINSKLCIIEGATHAVNMTHYKEVNQAIVYG